MLWVIEKNLLGQIAYRLLFRMTCLNLYKNGEEINLTFNITPGVTDWTYLTMSYWIYSDKGERLEIDPAGQINFGSPGIAIVV